MLISLETMHRLTLQEALNIKIGVTMPKKLFYTTNAVIKSFLIILTMPVNYYLETKNSSF